MKHLVQDQYTTVLHCEGNGRRCVRIHHASTECRWICTTDEVTRDFELVLLDGQGESAAPVERSGPHPRLHKALKALGDGPLEDEVMLRQRRILCFAPAAHFCV
eukprot:Mycagemm_TRINITY_DN10280_c0_g9::TRINITY_DN10280_c0_g9_i1::g.3771::m.3771 type:complete len:104 gc:universal TRINITY_DN10280_c0_g9_i1:657-968(+)